MISFPEIIIHNSVSADGSLTGFMPNMEEHYRIAGEFSPEIHLIGSETIIKGIEMFGGEVPPEEPYDFKKPVRNKNLPLWAVIDSGGKLMGLHHTSRRFEFCRDVVVVVSSSTSRDYLGHLEERNYDIVVAGNEKVDLPSAIKKLAKKYNAGTILTDTGMVLGNLLLNLRLVSRVSMLIHPIVIGTSCYNMFSNVKGDLKLELIKKEETGKGLVWLLYKVI